MTDSSLDLRQLAVDRTPAPTGVIQRRHRWISRFVVPGVILMGFVSLLAVAAGMQFLPVPHVTVVPVITIRGDVQQAGTVLFQAPGWIEPRPTSIRAAALTSGVVEELLVVDGQEVRKGETVARLITADAKLNVEHARATVAFREAELQRVTADQVAAKSRFENPVHLQADLGDAENSLARTVTEIEKLPFLLRNAKAGVEFAQQNLTSKQAAESAIPIILLKQVERDHKSAEADLEELQIREPNLQREADALRSRVAALRQQTSLLIEEHRRVAETNAIVDSAKAQLQEARLKLQQAELAFERTEIKAPITGRVLRIVAAPGNRVMGLEELAGQSSSTILEMYDPQRLQVRADVRLEDVARVVPGAPVEIETAACKGVLQGRVLLPTSVASVQKNTLEVKVELLNPPQTASPEMLVKVSFLAPEDPKADSSAITQTDKMFIPDSLVSDTDGQSYVWIVDGQQQARHVAIQRGHSTPDGLTNVISGLQVTDKLIASGTEQLADGINVKIRTEDQTLGLRR